MKGVSQYLRVELGLEKSQKNANLLHMPHIASMTKGHRSFRMGQESLCLLFLYVQCQLRMNWPSTDDIYGFCSGRI